MSYQKELLTNFKVSILEEDNSLTKPFHSVAQVFRSKFPAGEVNIKVEYQHNISLWKSASAHIYAGIESSDDVMTLLLLTSVLRSDFPKSNISLSYPVSSLFPAR